MATTTLAPRTTKWDKQNQQMPPLFNGDHLTRAEYDLHEKLRVYRRNGVQEYLVLLAYEQETCWFQLVEGEYKLLQPDEAGALQSQVFPGLHFQPDLFWSDNLAEQLKVLQAGLATAEHHAFVTELQAQQTK
jgi:hypothetical protein